MSRPRDGLSWTAGVEAKLAELGVLDEVRAEVVAGVDLEPLTVRLGELIGPDLEVEGETDLISSDWSLSLRSQLYGDGEEEWLLVAEWGPPDY